MNKLFLIAALAAAVATPALAGSITGEVRTIDPQPAKIANSTEYRLTYSETVANIANVGAEFTGSQPYHNGTLNSKIVLQGGPALPTVAGFTPAAYGEYGRSLNTNKDFNFWGYGASVSHEVYGPVSVNVGYRHRQGPNTPTFTEDRLNGGVAFAITEDNIVGVNYYRTRSNSVTSDILGVNYTRNF